jgi:hypothetical protein
MTYARYGSIEWSRTRTRLMAAAEVRALSVLARRSQHGGPS